MRVLFETSLPRPTHLEGVGNVTGSAQDTQNPAGQRQLQRLMTGTTDTRKDSADDSAKWTSLVVVLVGITHTTKTIALIAMTLSVAPKLNFETKEHLDGVPVASLEQRGGQPKLLGALTAEAATPGGDCGQGGKDSEGCGQEKPSKGA